MGNFAARFRYIEDESYFGFGMPVVGWAGPDGQLSHSVEDRFTSHYLRRAPLGGIPVLEDSLAEDGLQVLSLKDAMKLGFTTSEYHAALRVQMLRSTLIENEEELAAELLPPSDFSEAVERENCLDEYYEWPPERPAERIPYPSEDWFAHERAVGWLTPNGRLSKERPTDRFDQQWLVRDKFTGELRFSASTIREIGIESLSLADAVKLGFSTVEYRTALRVRLFERRHLRDENDLARAISPPLKVQESFDRWGRIFLEPEKRDLVWGYHVWDTEEPIRTWMRGDDAADRSFNP